MNQTIPKAHKVQQRPLSSVVVWQQMAYPVPYPVEGDVHVIDRGSMRIISYRTTRVDATVFPLELSPESSESLQAFLRLVNEEGEPDTMSDFAAFQAIAMVCRDVQSEPFPIAYLRRHDDEWRIARTMPDAVWTIPTELDSVDDACRRALFDANEKGVFSVKVVYVHRSPIECTVTKVTP